MDSQQDSLLEISESDRYTNMLLSNNLTEIFQNDYYSKFKNSQNIFEPSMTMSRVSQIDKTSEDQSNITHIRMIHTSERLVQMINNNQLLENKVMAQARMITELSSQLNAKEQQLQESIRQCERLNKDLSDEQSENQKSKKHIKELQFIINSQLMQSQIMKSMNTYDMRTETLQTSVECPSIRPSSQPRGKRGQNHSYTSSRAFFTKILTEEPQIKHKEKFSKSDCIKQSELITKQGKQKYYRSQSNFWSSVTTSPLPGKSNHTNTSAHKIGQTEKRIENTLSILKAIKIQCTQFASSKKQQ